MFSLATVLFTACFTCCSVITNAKPTTYDLHQLQLVSDLTSQPDVDSITSDVGEFPETSLTTEKDDIKQLLASLVPRDRLTPPAYVTKTTGLIKGYPLEESLSTPDHSSWQSVLQAFRNQGEGETANQSWTHQLRERSSSVEKRSVGVRSRCCYVDVFCYRGCFRELHNRVRYKRQIAAKLQR